jgi:hypothetical protein
MLDLGKLAGLKQLLIDAKDFGDVYGYFMDHFGRSPELVTLGEPYQDALFVAALERIGGALSGGRDARLEQPFLLRIADHRFVHGVFAIGDRMASVLYFEDIERGLLGFGGRDSEGPSQFARFTLAAVAPGLPAATKGSKLN